MDTKTGDPLNGSPRQERAALRTLLGRTNRDWWPNQLSLEILHQQGADRRTPSATISIMPRRSRRSTIGGEARPTALMTDSQPWWPADYGTTALLHPHGVARARHLSHRRRARRGQFGPAALRPAQLVAGQCQSRQGAAPALADQAKYGRNLAGPISSSSPATSRSNRWAGRLRLGGGCASISSRAGLGLGRKTQIAPSAPRTNGGGRRHRDGEPAWAVNRASFA